MRVRTPRAVPVVAAAGMFIVSAVTRASGPAPPPKAPSVAAFAPLRIRTTALTATGAGSTEAPFSLKVTTQALAAQGLGTREPPFRPLVVKTDALTAQGRSAAPGGPK